MSFDGELDLDLPKNIIKKRSGSGSASEVKKESSPDEKPAKPAFRKQPALTPFAVYHLVSCMREAGRRLGLSDTTSARAATLMHRALCVLITGKDPISATSEAPAAAMQPLSLADGVMDETDLDARDHNTRRLATGDAIEESFRTSLGSVDPHTLAMACISLAGKVQEEHQRLRDVVLAYHRTLHPDSVLEANDMYEDLRESLVQGELLLMRLLSFDVRQPSLPHAYLLHYLSALMHWIGRGTVASLPQDEHQLALSRLPGLAWSILADSYHAPLCLHFLPEHVAAAILHLSLRIAGVEVPGNRQSRVAWWQAISSTLTREIVEQIQLKVMNVYTVDDIMHGSFKTSRY